MQLAQKIGKPYREGFVKNRYVGRTFIMPGQQVRKKSVRQKLNAIGMEFKGRNVLLVDDSIVRGTTSKEIVQMAREAGARKVYMASAAPPVRYPNVYGIDMPTREELIAHGRTSRRSAQFIGADALIYQDVDAMKRVVGALNPSARRLRGQLLRRPVHHRRRQRRRLRRRWRPSAACSRRERGRRRPHAPDAAERERARPTTMPRSIRAHDLPAGLRPETLAVRDGLAPSQHGENSEALFLTSAFVQPDAETSARRFANEEEDFIYSRSSNPTVRSMEQRLAAMEGTDGLHRHRHRHGAILLLSWACSRRATTWSARSSVFGSTIRLLPGFGKFGVETSFVSQTDVAQWRAACGRTRSCCLPRRRPTR